MLLVLLLFVNPVLPIGDPPFFKKENKKMRNIEKNSHNGSELFANLCSRFFSKLIEIICFNTLLCTSKGVVVIAVPPTPPPPIEMLFQGFRQNFS